MAQLVESSAEGIIYLGLDRTVEYLNPAATNLFGFTKTEAIHQHPRMLWLPTNYEATYEHDMTTVTNGRCVEPFEAVWKHRDGREITVDVTMSAVRDAIGHCVGVSVFVRDVTLETMVLRRQFERQAKLVHTACMRKAGKMIGAIAHELNQPLTVIALLTDTITQPGQNLAITAQHINEHTARCVTLVRRMRDGQMNPDRQSIDLRELIKTSVSSALLACQPVSIETELELHSVNIAVDHEQIHQVLINLVRNALEAMQNQTGRLSITTRLLDGHVEIAIADDGPGIDAGIVNRLFQPYVTTKPNGLGIGLSICKEIIQAHGGTLSFQPYRTKGACFIIDLPVE
jgi:PAS domain S-box-containing protein